MAEWSNAAVSKTVEPLRVPWVQIPPSPPKYFLSPLPAQNANAPSQGTVTDPSGAAVAGAAVELINSGTREHCQATTSSSGNYDFTALPPGEFKVKATTSGFSEWSGRVGIAKSILPWNVETDAVVKPGLTAAS